MAYIDFAPETLSGVPAEPRHDPTPRVEPGLSALEWSVVALARNDRMASLSQPGRMSIALAKVFGTRRQSPRLADPKLEALRRMAVLSWHRGFSVASSEVKAFFRAGFSAHQYEMMVASIGAARAHTAATARR